MDFSADQSFHALFEHLQARLQSKSAANYSDFPVSEHEAPQLFLASTNSSQDLCKMHQLTRTLCSPSAPLPQQAPTCTVSPLVEALLAQAKAEPTAISRKSSQLQRQLTQQCQRFVSGLICDTRKEQVQALAHLDREKHAIAQQKVRLKEDFLWRRLVWAAEAVDRENVRVTDAAPASFPELRKSLKEYLGSDVKIKRALSVETRQYAELYSMRLPGFNSQKVKVVDICKRHLGRDSSNAQEVLSQLILGQPRQTIPARAGLLNRACKF